MNGLENDAPQGGGGLGRALGSQESTREQMNIEDSADRAHTGARRRVRMARAIAKRGLVAFLAFAMAFGTTPTQLWADGAEGIAEAVMTAAEPADGAAGAEGNATFDEAAAEGQTGSDAVEGTAADTVASTAAQGASTGEAGASNSSAVSENSTSQPSDGTAAPAVQDTGDKAADEVNVFCSVVGVDANGNRQDWAGAKGYTLKAGSTAADLAIEMFKATGLTADYNPDGAYGFYLNTITSPFDSSQTLGWDAATGRYWQLFVNGQSSMLGASSVKLNEGDSIVWAYCADGSTAPSVQLSVTGGIIGADADGNAQSWAPTQGYKVEAGETAADLTIKMLNAAGLTADYDPNTAYGFYLNTITSPDKSQTLGWNSATRKYWRLYVNGEASSLGASSVCLHEGDSVVWAYASDEDPLPTDEISVTCEVIGKDKNGKQQTWAQPTSVSVKDGANAADASEVALAGLDPEIKHTWGWFLNGLTSPYDKSNTLRTTEDYSAYWNLFINGKASQFGADQVQLKPGDKITWLYGSYTDPLPGQISVTMSVIGRWDYKYQRWSNPSQQTFLEGTNLRDACDEYLTACGFEPVFWSEGGDSWSLISMKNPFNGMDQSLYWVCFVNGKRADESQVEELKSGDSIVWVYSPEGDTIPDPDEVVVDPDAKRPTDWKADWSGSENATTDAKTPAGDTAAAWTFDWKSYAGSTYPNASEPIVVNGYVYLAVDNHLLKIDSQTGKVLASGNLKAKVGYTSRPVYAKGVIIVPLDGGAVQALTADELTTVWVTDGIGDNTQSNAMLTVSGNYVYVGTVDVSYDKNWNSKFDNGHLRCINISSGAVIWDHINADEGYYWTGATVADGCVVVPTSAGTVELLDKSTGKVLSSCQLGSVVNSSVVVSADGASLYVISRDGKLHVLELTKSGYSVTGISEIKAIDLGLTGSACYPTMMDGKLIVGGEANGNSALAIVDLTMFTTQLITTADGAAMSAGNGGIKGAPLVSEQDGATYVYFTVNNGETTDYVNYTAGGGVYRYKLGDKEATSIYSAKGHNNYCDSPVVCDKDGNLYYINDSGTLFRLSNGIKVSFDTAGGSSVAADTVVKDGKLVKPADPTRSGYTFGGWFTDAACTQAYDFGSPVTTALTLYAKWTVAPADKDDNKGSDASSKGDNSNGGATSTNPAASNGNGTQGRQSGGAVAPSSTPVNKTAASADAEKAKESSKTSKKSDKKSGSNSDKKDDGKSSDAAALSARVAGADADEAFGVSANPLAIVGVAAGVIGLAVVAVFIARNRKGSNDVR